MSDTKELKPTPSLKERRNAVVRGLGREAKSRATMGKVSGTWWAIFLIASGFVMWGLIMVFSSSAVTNLHTGDSPWRILIRQLMWVSVGLAIGLFVYRMPYETWNNTVWMWLVVGTVWFMNAVVIVKGALVNGANAWLDVFGMRIQPSEFMKLSMILLAASVLSVRHRSVQIRQVVLYPMYFVIGVPILLCFLQKDFGGALVFAGIGFVLLFVAGVPGLQLGGTLGIGVLGAALVVKYAGRASDRFTTFWNVEANKEHSGFQVWQSMLSIANGGVFGTGIGSGTSKWGYVPLAYSDFIFAVVAEEMGAGGVILLIGGFIAFAGFGIRVAIRARDRHGSFIAAGITAWFSVQAMVHIGGVVGVMPMTGLTLPFISYGGSSLVASMAATGLLLNVARVTKAS